MPRVKRGMRHAKRRSNILKRVKGFEGGRKKLLKLAKTADTKAGAHAYRDRRVKKRTTRNLWQVKINAEIRKHGMSYSKFMGALKKNDILLDRKVLSQIAEKHPKMFAAIVKSVS
ncbi:MAG: 50S ribosomal protein L20 [Candidatus Magasanikbacteria bacterium]|nr:50S ribosomal protein L20 [Candidatus Magasanikbacteria bacterium]